MGPTEPWYSTLPMALITKTPKSSSVLGTRVSMVRACELMKASDFQNTLWPSSSRKNSRPRLGKLACGEVDANLSLLRSYEAMVWSQVVSLLGLEKVLVLVHHWPMCQVPLCQQVGRQLVRPQRSQGQATHLNKKVEHNDNVPFVCWECAPVHLNAIVLAELQGC